MPQRENSQKPPEAMTNARRLEIVIVAGLIDALRLFFTMFWFFGPAIAAGACVHTANGWIGSSLWGLTSVICASGAAAAGAYISEITVPFGVVIAMVVGFAGFLILGLWVVMTNMRIFKTVESAPLQFAGAFAMSEIPFIDAIPVFSIILWRLYGVQIRVEQAALKKWEKEHKEEIANQRREQQRQAAYLMQARTDELAQDEIY